jgi:CheY-like chemotaxis protein
MISNLLNNAAKYTNPGGRVWLVVDATDREVAIRVKDDGIGIPGEMLPRVFELFTQVDRSSEQAESGLGIGLTLVQRLAEMHGGSVEALSDGPGRGSEFVVRVPLVPAPSAAPRDRSAGDSFDAAALRILIVDDNADSAESLGMVLRMLGHTVETAHDGLAAMEASASFHPDVVLLDIGLPRMSGYEVARRLRGREEGERTMLVALTGWGQAADRDRSREAGFDHHMTKPVDFAALQRLLERRGRPDAAGAADEQGTGT